MLLAYSALMGASLVLSNCSVPECPLPAKSQLLSALALGSAFGKEINTFSRLCIQARLEGWVCPESPSTAQPSPCLYEPGELSKYCSPLWGLDNSLCSLLITLPMLQGGGGPKPAQN